MGQEPDPAPPASSAPAGSEEARRGGGAAVEPAPVAPPAESVALRGGEAAIEPPPAAAPAEHLERRARLAEDRLSEVLAAFRRERSDNEGFRERVKREAERHFDRRREKLLLKFIEILDNLDRALEAAQRADAGDALVDGLILVRTQLLQTLQHEGLERAPVLGRPFDPALAEAVQTQTVADEEQHELVVRELVRCYRLRGRVVRPARVVVGIFEPAQTASDGVATTAAASEPEPADPDAEAGRRTEESSAEGVGAEQDSAAAPLAESSAAIGASGAAPEPAALDQGSADAQPRAAGAAALTEMLPIDSHALRAIFGGEDENSSDEGS